MKPFLIWASVCLFAAALIGAVFVAARLAQHSQPLDVASQRVLEKYSAARGHQLSLGLPLESPARWEKVAAGSNDNLTTESGAAFARSGELTLLLVYQNGQVLDRSGASLPLPEGVHYLEQAKSRATEVLDLNALESGNKQVAVTHRASRSRPNDSNYYETRLKNLSNRRVRVVRFGGYMPQGQRWVLNNMSGEFYSADQFRAWYGMKDDPWIDPGETVSDPENYGGGPVIWAYHFEDEAGNSFVAGGEHP